MFHSRVVLAPFLDGSLSVLLNPLVIVIYFLFCLILIYPKQQILSFLSDPHTLLHTYTVITSFPVLISISLLPYVDFRLKIGLTFKSQYHCNIVFALHFLNLCLLRLILQRTKIVDGNLICWRNSNTTPMGFLYMCPFLKIKDCNIKKVSSSGLF